MNACIQAEHSVAERISGLGFPSGQVTIAQGLSLEPNTVHAADCDAFSAKMPAALAGWRYYNPKTRSPLKRLDGLALRAGNLTADRLRKAGFPAAAAAPAVIS